MPPRNPIVVVARQAQPVVVVERRIVAEIVTTPVLPAPVESSQEPKPCVIVSPCPSNVPGGENDDVVILVAGATIHGQRAVRVDDDLIYHPDRAVAAHAPAVIGVAEQAGLTGAELRVRIRGQMTYSGWDWEPGFVFVGTDGALTQTPGAGWLLSIGRVLDPSTIDVQVGLPIIRST